ncbi:MAG: hypothetical protein JW931_06235 [Methanomicrobiaceae archaeon]|nr:hypothetical protein [Methanomicrobiaceae archaeon]
MILFELDTVSIIASVIFLIIIPVLLTTFFAIIGWIVLDKFIPQVACVLPVIFAVVVSLLAPFLSSVVPLVVILLITAGILTSFNLLNGFFDKKHHYRVIFMCIVLVYLVRAVLTSAMASFGLEVSPVIPYIISVSSSNAVFAILVSLTLYIGAVIVSMIVLRGIYPVARTAGRNRGNEREEKEVFSF